MMKRDDSTGSSGAPGHGREGGLMRLRHAAAGIVVMFMTVVTVGPAEAHSSGICSDEQSTQPQPPYELRFGGPSVSWDEAVRDSNRQLSEAESEAAIADSERNSSMSDYYPDRPDDPIENPPPPTETAENPTQVRSCP